MPAPRPTAPTLVALLPLLAACSSLTTTSSGSTATGSTAILVDPSAFLGTMSCGNTPGELMTYVATLVEVTRYPDGGVPAVIPSSPPAACYEQVIFEKVTDGHEYEARIDGYDVAGIHPASAGSSQMLDVNGLVVSPRWSATCGEPSSEADGGADAGQVALRDAAIGEYGDCRSRLLPDAHATGDLSGPVCAYENLTITMRHCTPLRPR